MLRWLLVLAILAGMGLWQGAHCPETIAAASSAGHDHQAAPAAPATDPGSTLAVESDDCHLVPATAVSTIVGARLPLPSAVRIPSVASPPQPVRTRLVPAVALATIGVCRT